MSEQMFILGTNWVSPGQGCENCYEWVKPVVHVKEG